jgi:hypothetical protein
VPDIDEVMLEPPVSSCRVTGAGVVLSHGARVWLSGYASWLLSHSHASWTVGWLVILRGGR